TAANCWPCWLYTEYSLLTSMSLVFWLTTRTGSVYKVPPPCWVPATPACCCTCCWIRDGSCAPSTFSSANCSSWPGSPGRPPGCCCACGGYCCCCGWGCCCGGVAPGCCACCGGTAVGC